MATTPPPSDAVRMAMLAHASYAAAIASQQRKPTILGEWSRFGRLGREAERHQRAAEMAQLIAEARRHIAASREILESNSLKLSWNVVRPNKQRDWLNELGSLIPKGIREPWLGDLREDRNRWRNEGAGRLRVECRTVSQLLCLMAAALWDDIKETIARSFRVS